MSANVSRLVALWGLPLLLTAFLGVTLRVGVPWAGSGNDLGKSIFFGLNLLEGREFSDLSHYQTTSLSVSELGERHLFPVLYSLLNRFLYTSFEISTYFLVFKVFAVSFIFFMLVSFARIVCLHDSLTLSAASVLLFGGAPFVLEFKEQVRGDLIFMALLYFVIWRRNAWGSRPDLLSGLFPEIREGLILILALSLAIGVRSLAVILPPAMIFHDLVTKRRVSVSTTVATVGAGLFYIIQSRITGNVETTYAKGFSFLLDLSFHDTLSTVIVNVNGF